MLQTDYTYAVARIRANETSLLTKSDIEQLVAADGYPAAVRLLTDRGWKEPDENSVYDICETELAGAWNLITESIPDRNILDALVIGNDFANLKAAIKAGFYKAQAENYMTSPCLCDPETIIQAVREADFSLLPDYLAECADKAYHAYTEKQSGQLTEMIIDKACLSARQEYAAKSESPLLGKITDIICAVSDIKTARRCVTTGKTKEFALEALSGCGKIDGVRLADAAYANEKLAPVIAEAGLDEIAEYADSDFTALEMKCDNFITDMIKSSKYEVFGPDPVIAYYYAKIAEVKNVRIILSAKASGVPVDIISQRVREIYV
ncbi:MAG: V-type ATPase subunit [Clostridia bacterium]|nr:V-type ATPase subunit [Clostridia bacterium]